MKKLVLFAVVFTLGTLLYAQPFKNLDKSPLDISYYPDEYAHDRKFAPEKIGGLPAIARIIYSRPARKDRELYGKLIPYDKIWRLGSNEAVEIKFYQKVSLEGKKVKAGTYALFAIPGEKNWTLILNSDLDHWGTYSYQEQLDVLRVSVPVKALDNMVENFTIQFKKVNENSAVMQIAWEKTLVECTLGF